MKARPKQRTMRNVTTAVAGTATATGDERRETRSGAEQAKEKSEDVVQCNGEPDREGGNG